MAIKESSKKKFIDGMVKDLTAKIPDASPETIKGIEDYSSDLCNRIVSLIKEASITTDAGTYYVK
jgi:hypothetical protein